MGLERKTLLWTWERREKDRRVGGKQEVEGVIVR